MTKEHKILKYCAALALIIAIVAISVVAFTGGFDAEAASVVKRGSSGTTVRTIQTKLKNWGYYTGSVDGIFGSKTEAAVKYFQRRNGLSVDGIVGSKTAAAMGIRLSSSSSSTSSSASSSDLNLLAHLVYAEARGEPYVGQVAVAAVVLNRVRSSSFPNTVSGVIYQPWAFTCVNDGQINLSPNNTAISAARDAINGWDPTYGCLYYYNPSTATSSWMRAKTVTLNIGSHAFCL